MARLCRQDPAVAGPFVCRCLTRLAVPRFHLPLIEPDVRIARIRLADGFHRLAHSPAVPGFRQPTPFLPEPPNLVRRL